MSGSDQDSVRQQFESVVLTHIFDKPNLDPKTMGEARFERLRRELMNSELGRNHLSLLEKDMYYNSLNTEFSFAVQRVMPKAALQDGKRELSLGQEIKAILTAALMSLRHPDLVNKSTKAMDEMYRVYSQTSAGGPKAL